MNQAVIPPPASIDRCWQLLQRWRGELKLTRREQGVLAGSMVVLDRQLDRLKTRRLRIAVFGRVLAIQPDQCLDRRGHGDGCRPRKNKASAGSELADFDPWTGSDRPDRHPGIDEIQAAARARLASRIAMEADLVLLVIDSDLSRTDKDAPRCCRRPVSHSIWSSTESTAGKLMRSQR